MKKDAPPFWKGPAVRALTLASAGAAAFAIGIVITRPEAAGDVRPDEVVGVALHAPSHALQLQPPAIDVRGPQLPVDAGRLSEHVTYNPFAALNLNIAPSPAPVASAVKAVQKKPEPAPPPPPPTAPPLPFTAVGSIAGAQVTGGQSIAFVKQQDQLLVIHSGDTIGPSYRVESVTAQRIEFTYLPLMQRQTLMLAP
jgi:hypothetical protein